MDFRSIVWTVNISLVCVLTLLSLGNTKVKANAFSRSGDPRLHCWVCRNDNEACPRIQDSMNITCPLGTEACLKFSEGSVMKITGRRNNLDIVGGYRACLDPLVIREQQAFGILSFGIDACYRNLDFSQMMTGSVDSQIRFKGDICVCTSDNCNGSSELLGSTLLLSVLAGFLSLR